MDKALKLCPCSNFPLPWKTFGRPWPELPEQLVLAHSHPKESLERSIQRKPQQPNWFLSSSLESIQESPKVDLQGWDDPWGVKFPGFLRSNGWDSSCTLSRWAFTRFIKVIYPRNSSRVPSSGSFSPFHPCPHLRKSQFCGSSNKSFIPRHLGEGLGWTGSTERRFPCWELHPRDYEGSWCPIHGELWIFPNFWIFWIFLAFPGWCQVTPHMARDALTLCAGISWHKAHFPGWKKSN